MASQILRRIVAQATREAIITAANRVIDMLNGNSPGRINLDGDDGAEKNPIGGAAISSNNHALRVRSAAGEHVLVRNTADTVNLFEVDDTSGVTIGGNLTFLSTLKRILADFSNATVSNRTLFKSSTTNGETRVGAIPNGTATQAGFAGYSSATPDNSHFWELMANATANTIDLISNKVGTGTIRNLRLISGTTVFAELTTGFAIRMRNTRWFAGLKADNTTEVPLARVNGSDQIEIGESGTQMSLLSPLKNNTPLYGTTTTPATVALINMNGSNQIDTGATGTRHNLLGTVVAPSINPPTVNGQVTRSSQAAGVYSGYVAGGVLYPGDGNYNVASATRNSAGNFSVAWDRDFTSIYYMAQVTIEHPSRLMVRINSSKAASGLDVLVETTAGVATDPDGFHVLAFGTLS